MILPGLVRISQLLKRTTLSWRAVHIAGTNGKGSVCAYVSAMLHAAKIKTGRFTSPHLIDRWDCITIDEQVIDESRFRRTEQAVKTRDLAENINASEFEILTAIAFELFALEKVEVGVIEVGLGGQHDATNVIKDPLVTVITKIGKDHQSILGNTVEEIATHKAGIMKHGVPCVVDATNQQTVIQIFEKIALEVGAGPVIQVRSDVGEESAALQSFLVEQDLAHHQRINLSLAYLASKEVLQQRASIACLPALLDGARRTFWPGRLHSVHIAALTGREEPVLVDGAHNAQSAQVLGLFVDEKIRTKPHPVTWVIAISLGKEVRELLQSLCQPEDNVVAVEFGKVDGMPWVSSVDPCVILQVARGLGISGLLLAAGRDIASALKLADSISAAKPIVICGSLYLVSDVFRLFRTVANSTAAL
ncbi:MAG: hypothetical protein Q9170_003344 [Blastenia crenularia]